MKTIITIEENGHLLDGSPGSKVLSKDAEQITSGNDIGGRGFDFFDED